MMALGVSLFDLAPRQCRIAGRLSDYQLSGHVPKLVWDFETGFLSAMPLPLLRASTASYSSRTGILRHARVNEARYVFPTGRRALLIESTASNLCQAQSVPVLNGGLSNNGQAVLSLVDATAALTTAGLQLVTGGHAYRIDNSAGASYAFCLIEGASADSTAQIASAWARKVSGPAGQNVVRIGGAAGQQSPDINSSGFSLYSTASSIPSNSKRMLIRIEAGAVLDFVLPWYRPATHTGSYVFRTGTAQTRAADVLTLSTAPYGLNSDQHFRAVTDNGEMTLQASGGTLVLPAGRYHLLHDVS